MKTEQRKIYEREWRKRNMDRVREQRNKWKRAHPEIMRESSRKRIAKNPEKEKARVLRWRQNNLERSKMTNSMLHQNYKRTVIDAYGGHCKCCGENEIAFLTLEHTKKDGKIHRQVKGVFYLSLIRRRFPQDEGLSVLCMNCNWAERNGKQCPHKMAVKKVFEVIG